MIRRPPRSTQSRSSAASDVYKRQHSAEIVVEAEPSSIVWVDKSRRRAVTAPESDLLAELAGAIGSQFNLRAARALKTDLALFVEGNDNVILKNIARTIGANGVANEKRIAVAPLGGVTNWHKLEG